MSNNAQGFWGIQDLNHEIVKINSVALGTPIKAADYPGADSNYTIELDDTNNNVLILHSTTATTLRLSDGNDEYDVIGEPIEYFIGQKPRRPH